MKKFIVVQKWNCENKLSRAVKLDFGELLCHVRLFGVCAEIEFNLKNLIIIRLVSVRIKLSNFIFHSGTTESFESSTKALKNHSHCTNFLNYLRKKND